MISVVQNVTKEEIEKISAWFEKFSPITQTRVEQTLQALLNTSFYFEKSSQEELFSENVAIIAAGSSIDSNIYKDIDLFVIPEHSIYGNRRLRARQALHAMENASISFFRTMVRRLMPGVTIENFVAYEANLVREFHKTLDRVWEGGPAIEKKQKIDGTPVSVMFFPEQELYERRKNHKDDLLDHPKLDAGSEDILAYNRRQDSKFIILSRQYSPPVQEEFKVVNVERPEYLC